MATSTRRIYEFLGFRLEPAERLLARDGKPVAVTPKGLRHSCFPGGKCRPSDHKRRIHERGMVAAFVEESTLAQSISQLRKALGDSEVIDTVPKKGYRFRGAVRTVDSPVIAKSTESIPKHCRASFSTTGPK